MMNYLFVVDGDNFAPKNNVSQADVVVEQTINRIQNLHHILNSEGLKSYWWWNHPESYKNWSYYEKIWMNQLQKVTQKVWKV